MPPNDPFLRLLDSTHNETLYTQGHFNASRRRQYWQQRYERLAALVEPLVRAAIAETDAEGPWLPPYGAQGMIRPRLERRAAVDALLAGLGADGTGDE